MKQSDKEKRPNRKGLIYAVLILAALILYPILKNGDGSTSSDEELLSNGISLNLPSSSSDNGVSAYTASELRGLEIPYLLEPDKEQNTVVEHMGYTLSYNSLLRIPNWVAYELQDSELYGDFERGDEFNPDPQIRGRQAYDSDYRGSGWDRGHLAPSGDMKWSSQVQKECFYLSNVCPQSHNLNAGLWNDLEKQVRYEARYYGTIWIVTGPVVGDARYGTIGENKVTIPDGFFKALLAKDKKTGEFLSIGFYFPNESCSGDLADYAMSVNELEEIVGMDLFNNLDYSVQEEVEDRFDPWEWRIGDR
ncbi:MAG: DNA/RNA non-specific endonuclease [Bacteroidales bacterium]|nr:DNA/RNA non-specific endonuclease [Bacteroidales bacterium]